MLKIGVDFDGVAPVTRHQSKKEMLMRYAMAAAKPGGSDVIRKIELGAMSPSAEEVLIRHDAIGLNFLDIYIRNGAYSWPVDTDLVLGSEGAGVIEAVGSKYLPIFLLFFKGPGPGPGRGPGPLRPLGKLGPLGPLGPWAQ